MTQESRLVAYLITALLVLLSGTFSGLTIGLMRLDLASLRRRAKLGDRDAAAILPLRRNDNQLLASLILGNVAANSILAVYLGTLTTGLIASVLATILIAVFGDILPQAFFTRYTRQLSTWVVPVAQLVLWVCTPIAGPIAWVLDRVLGAELPTLHSREEILAMVEEHRVNAGGTIDIQEEAIVKGALSFSGKRIRQIMTPAQNVQSVREDQTLSLQVLKKLQASGHSRFPVLEPTKGAPIGILYLRDLAGMVVDGQTAGQLARPQMYFVNELLPLDDVMNAFAKTKSHLYIVVDEHEQMTGVVSIEDVLAEILGHELRDSFTQYNDLEKVAHRPTHSTKREE